jgi:hypothetical protein
MSNIKTANIFSKKVEEFKYFGTTVTKQYLINEEIRIRSKFGLAKYK